MKKFLLSLLSLLMAVSAALVPVTAYAASSNLELYYIENISGKAWDNIPYTQFNKTQSSTGCNINGFFYNYYDTANYCLYVRLAYTYTGDGKVRSNAIHYYFTIENSAHTYEFHLTSGGKKEYCAVTCTSASDVIGQKLNVMGYTESEVFQNNQVIAIVNIGVELLNSQDKKLDTTVSFWPNINGKFKILDYDLLLENEPVTTTKATTTTTAKTTTTKATTTTTTKAATAKTTTTTTAKAATTTTTIPTVQVQTTSAATVAVYTGSGSSGSSGSSGGSGSSSSGELSTVSIATPLQAEVATTSAASGGLLKVDVADSGSSGTSGGSSSGTSGSSGGSSSGTSGSSGSSSSKYSSGGSSSAGNTANATGSSAGSSAGEYAAADAYAETAYEGAGTSPEYAVVTESENTMSVPARIMLWVAVVVIVIGIALIIIAAVFRHLAKKEAQNNNNGVIL